jgi:hypothetical protein
MKDKDYIKVLELALKYSCWKHSVLGYEQTCIDQSKRLLGFKVNKKDTGSSDRALFNKYLLSKRVEPQNPGDMMWTK